MFTGCVYVPANTAAYTTPILRTVLRRAKARRGLRARVKFNLQGGGCPAVVKRVSEVKHRKGEVPHKNARGDYWAPAEEPAEQRQGIHANLSGELLFNAGALGRHVSSPYETGGDEPQPNSGQRRVLGIVLLIIVLFSASVTIYFSAVILGAFFSYFIPLDSNLPVAVQNQLAGIPTTAFLALDIFVGGVAIIAVVGILKIIFGI